MEVARPSSRFFKEFAPAAIIVAAVLIAYKPAMRAGFIWDDDRYVTKNVTLRDAAGLKRVWFDVGATPQYYPLVFTTFWIERGMWNGRSTGYHVTNAVLHAANCVLVWILLRRLSIPGAWFAAMLFAVHPVEVESVAWITERKNVLSGLFYLAAFLACLRFYGVNARDDSRRPRWGSYFLSLLLFSGALFSKTVTATLPVAIALILWWKNWPLRWRDIVPLIPMIVLGVAAGMFTVTFEREHVGAQGPDWAFSIVERTLIAGRAFWFYLYSIVAPVNLMFIYPRWGIDAGEWWQYLFPVTVLAVIVFFWVSRRKFGRGPLVAALFFVITLFPALGFLNVYPMRFSFVADHFQYLASIAPLAAIAAAGTKIFTRWPRAVGLTLFPIVVLWLISVTWRQGSMYKDGQTLWTETIRRNPNAWIAHNNLSEPLIARGDFNGAAEHARVTLRLRPNYAPAHNNLGLAFEGLQRNEEAVEQFRRAIELDPNLPWARLNLAGQLISHKDFDGAEQQYIQAITVAPELAETHYNYAVLLVMRRRIPEAVSQCRTACRLDPDDAQCRLLLRTLIGKDNLPGSN